MVTTSARSQVCPFRQFSKFSSSPKRHKNFVDDNLPFQKTVKSVVHLAHVHWPSIFIHTNRHQKINSTGTNNNPRPSLPRIKEILNSRKVGQSTCKKKRGRGRRTLLSSDRRDTNGQGADLRLC